MRRASPKPVLRSLSDEASWLCRAEFDRQRLLDMEGRLAPARTRTFGILMITLLAVGPWIGWWAALLALPASALWAVAGRLVDKVRRPEYPMFVAWVGGELTVAGAVWVQGGHYAAALPWLAIPVITLSSRFSVRGVVVGVSIAEALALTIGIGSNPSAFASNPVPVAVTVGLVLSVAVLTLPLMHSDVDHRSDAVVDELTGMLNRKALLTRTQELRQQSRVSGDQVGVIVADLDNFKAINDEHGHSTGDRVLCDVVALLRAELRAFDLAYRIGGEEFLVLLPGSGLAQAAELGERLRERVSSGRAGGLPVTISVGVGASAAGTPFDYASVFADADAALYRAKRAGRNRVEVARGKIAGAPVAAVA
jgi:diguanylate cyclase (GGDEF)-like protein